MKQLGKAIFEDVAKSLKDKCAEILLAAYAAEHSDVSPETRVRVHFIESSTLDRIERIAFQILVYLGYLEPTGQAENLYRITSKGNKLAKPFVDAKKAQRHLFEK